MRAFSAAVAMALLVPILAIVSPPPSADAVVSSDAHDWSSLKFSYGSPGNGDGGMPVGNARFGAKINGGVAQEVYSLNHKDWWSGDPKLVNDGQVGAVPGAAATTPEARTAAYNKTRQTLIAAYQEGISAADRAALMKQADRDAVGMWGTIQTDASYLPLGKLTLDVANTTGYNTYKRTIDIDSATTTVTYKVGTTVVTRETFLSYPDNVMAIRTYTNDGTPVSMAVNLALPAELAAAKLPDGTAVAENKVVVDAARNEIAMTARAPWLKSGTATWAADRGITAESRVKVQTANGQGITTSATGIQVNSSDSTLLFSAKTSYVDPFTDPSGPSAANPATFVRSALDAAAAKSWTTLKQRHADDWQAEFRTLWIELGGSPLMRGSQALQPMTYARHYQYARYIMLSTSRAGTNDRPHNQQSMWSLLWNPISFSSHFLNENVEKMYGLIETANLADSGDPLWKWIRNLAINGTETAAGSFGMNDGSWVTAHYSDVWAATEIRGAASRGNVGANEYAIWNSGGIWLMNNLYDSYEYSQDIEFLKSNYNLIEGATKFALNQLGTVPGVNGELKNYLSIIGPSTSPENRFSVDGTFVSVDINVTGDVELYNNLFEIIQRASADLQAAGYPVDTALVDRARDAQSKLVPLDMFIDPATGALKEWYNEYPSKDYAHRHSSHLLAWYPLNYTEVRDESAAVTAAAVAAYQQRGNSGGHPDRGSMGVRLGQITSGLTNPPHGLVDAVNTGWAQYGPIGASIGEALIDSRDDVIRILPFTPTEWSSGNVDGLRARGGFEVSIRWAGGVVDRVQIKSATGAVPVVEIGGQRIDPLTDPRVQLTGVTPPATAAPVAAGGVYTITASHSGKSLDSASSSAGSSTPPVVQNTSTAQATQRWRLLDAGNSLYNLQNESTGKCVEIAGGSTANNAAAVLSTCGTGSNQKFALTPNADGTRQIIANHSSRCLDVPGARTGNGEAIIQWACGSAANQKFTFVDVGLSGVYGLTVAHSSQAADIAGTTSNGIAQTTPSAATSQDWKLTRGSDGLYAIQNVANSRCMDVSGGSMAVGAAIIHWACSGSANQKWSVVASAGGKYQLKSFKSGLCVEVPAASQTVGAVLKQQTCSSADSQQWSLAR